MEEINVFRMRWTGHVARKGTGEMPVGYWWKYQKERDKEEGDVGACIIMKWI
jgi:hypothetical protein